FHRKNSEFHRGFTTSHGFIEGQITKDDIIKAVKNIHLYNPKETQLLLDEINKIALQSIDFRYDFTMKHSLLNGSIEQEGDVKITTPNIAAALIAIFKTYAPIHIKSNTAINGTHAEFSLKDISIKGAMLNSFNIITETTNDKKLKEYTFKIGKISMPSINSEIKGLEANLKFDEPIDLKQLFKFAKNYTVNFKIQSINAGNFVKLSDIADSAKVYESDGNIIAQDMFKIPLIDTDDMKFKDMLIDWNMKFDAKIGENLDELYKFASEDKEDEFLDIFKQSFKKGASLMIKELSIQNTNGDKLALNLDLSIDGEGFIQGIIDEDKNKFSKAIKFKGSLKSATTIDKLLAPYPKLAQGAPMIMLFGGRFIKPEGNGFSVDFALEGDKFKVNNIDVVDTSSIFNAGKNDKTSQNDDAEVSKAVANLETLLSDFSAYHTSQGKFDKLSNMTNVSLYEIDDTMATLKTKDKSCIKISLDKEHITVIKGDDADDEFCQKIYENKSVEERLEKPISVKPSL
ncbi:MAG: hypothetical protein ACTTIM_07285, partial [Campylobacter sp.]